MNKIQIGVDAIQSTPIILGFEGEQNHTEITFYWTVLFAQYPDAVATMVIKPPVGDPYPKTVTQEDNKVVWTVTAADMAHSGGGEYQLTFTDGEEVIKTYIGSFSVMNSIIGSGDPPDPIEDWITEANKALADLEAWEDIEVTGTTPSITGEANKRYVCGEVTTISITPPETGMIDVVFTSGATPTVLTTTGVTFPEWFSGTLEANTRYEINILDGYGVVSTWAST